MFETYIVKKKSPNRKGFVFKTHKMIICRGRTTLSNKNLVEPVARSWPAYSRCSHNFAENFCSSWRLAVCRPPRQVPLGSCWTVPTRSADGNSPCGCNCYRYSAFERTSRNPVPGRRTAPPRCSDWTCSEGFARSSCREICATRTKCDVSNHWQQKKKHFFFYYINIVLI